MKKVTNVISALLLGLFFLSSVQIVSAQKYDVEMMPAIMMGDVSGASGGWALYINTFLDSGDIIFSAPFWTGHLKMVYSQGQLYRAVIDCSERPEFFYDTGYYDPFCLQYIDDGQYPTLTEKQYFDWPVYELTEEMQRLIRNEGLEDSAQEEYPGENELGDVIVWGSFWDDPIGVLRYEVDGEVIATIETTEIYGCQVKNVSNDRKASLFCGKRKGSLGTNTWEVWELDFSVLPMQLSKLKPSTKGSAIKRVKANDGNARGDVVGYYQPINWVYVPLVWREGAKKAKKLMKKKHISSYDKSEGLVPTRINSSGKIIGYRYRRNKARELVVWKTAKRVKSLTKKLKKAGCDMNGNFAHEFINNNGQIFVQCDGKKGELKGKDLYVILTPRK